jgi:T5SS/PEP-CTERM-associated repeat protein
MSGASAGTIRSFGTVTIDGIYYEGYRGFGIVQLDAGARWTIGGTVASGTIVALAPGGTNVLTLANLAEMQGTITGFAQGDTIGADGITVTGSNYAGGVLTLTDTTGTISLDLPGNFTTGEFHVTNEAGNAEISILPRTLSWTGASGTAFGTAANWNDLTDSLNPAQSAPDPLDTVEFNTGDGGVIGTGTVATLDVGVAGSGVLQLTNAATIVAGSFDAGVGKADVAQIGVTGAGTELSVTGNAILADDGNGVMSVLSGATFAAANLTIGSQGDSSGAVIVSGDGSVIDISGDLNVGTALGTGDLTIGPGAVVDASVVNLQGEVVLENGELDPTVNLINQGQTAGGSGTIEAGDIVDEGVIQAGGSKPSENLLVVAGTVAGGGPWTIDGTAQPEANGDAGVLQINAGGTLELTGPVLDTASTTFTDDVTPQGTYTVNDSVVDVNFADGTGVLRLDDIGGFAGTIVSFQQGDEFVIAGGTLSGLGVTGGNTLTALDSGNGGTDQIIFSSGISASGFNIVNNNTIQVACFAAGTRIATPAGLVVVESLRAGDRVRTMRGDAAAIVWIGQRNVDCRQHPDPASVCPVRVLAGAFGPGLPSCDLWLSPDHAVFVEGVLIPIRCLIDGGTIRQMVVPEVTYYHVELPAHDVILAEDLPVESYLDTGDRANFSNGGGEVRLFPDFSARPNLSVRMWEMAGCAPLVMTGPVLERVRRILARAAVVTPVVSPVRPPDMGPSWTRLNNRYTYY